MSTDKLSKTASPLDQWEYDRALNIATTITENVKAGAYSGDPLGEATARKRLRESQAIMNHLVSKNLESDPVNAAVDLVDAKWVEANPRPKPEPGGDV